MSIAAVSAADKDRTPFRPPPADSFPNHQKIAGLIIAADAYGTKEEAKTAFGKLDPNKHGILPVLAVFQNETDGALRMDSMRVEYVRPDGRHIENIPAEDVPYIRGPKNPRRSASPRPRSPIPGLGGGKKKNPLAAWEIEGRAFANKMIPPRETAHGFFYFNTANHRGASLYITGIREAATGQELFFFEIPLE
ncbi:MAG: hypothetical protein GY953_22210 [bacterium]|nr:hypothetical protein [bacterium]